MHGLIFETSIWLLAGSTRELLCVDVCYYPYVFVLYILGACLNCISDDKRPRMPRLGLCKYEKLLHTQTTTYRKNYNFFGCYMFILPVRLTIRNMTRKISFVYIRRNTNLFLTIISLVKLFVFNRRPVKNFEHSLHPSLDWKRHGVSMRNVRFGFRDILARNEESCRIFRFQFHRL